MKNKIGILGGTFNPVHIGHLILAENAYSYAELDEVWFMPTGVSYLKNQNEILSADDRIKMLNYAINGNPHFSVSSYEVGISGNTYTCNTLVGLKELYPDNDFYFIVGEDSLEYMDKWKNPQIIFDNCTIIAAPRNCSDLTGINSVAEMLQTKFNAKIIILDVPALDISSNMIRNRVKNNKSCKYYLTDEVEKYIIDNDYYK